MNRTECDWMSSPVLSGRCVVPVPPGVPGVPGSHPSVGGGRPPEPSDQGGSPLRVAACYSSYVH